MTRTITLTISHPTIPSGNIQGFKQLWALYASGYRDREGVHCQACLTGPSEGRFNRFTSLVGTSLEFALPAKCQVLYLCGVGAGKTEQLWSKNFHAPLKYQNGVVAQWRTYNGYVLRAENAVILPVPIPPAEADWKNDSRLRCKNYQFALAYFGKEPRPGADLTDA